jgi:iron complex transport system substrate-binding protein
VTRFSHVLKWASPVLLSVVVTVVAFAVQHYASPPGGLQLPQAWAGDGDPTILTGSPQYPREAIDRDGSHVEIPHSAHRVVSEYHAIDEFVYSILPPQTVVAVSESAYEKRFSNAYPFAEQYKPVVAGDPERVLRLDPDLILVSDDTRPDYTSLMRSAGVPVYRMQTMFQTLKQVENAILLIGYLTGRDDAARNEALRFHTSIEIAHEKAANALKNGARPPRILGFGGTYSYGRETLFQDIVATLGGVNVGAEAGLKGYDRMNAEQILRWNPEWIVAGADPGKSEEVLQRFLDDPAISLTDAVRHKHILILENHVFLPLSPYTTLLVNAMADALYGPSSPGGHA